MHIVAYGLLLHAVNIRRAIGTKLRHSRPVGTRKLTLGEKKWEEKSQSKSFGREKGM